MKHWIVTHADGDQTRHYTAGDDPAAEGIDLGVACEEAPEPEHELQRFDRRTKRWKDCPKKKADAERLSRSRISHAELVELVLQLKARLDALESGGK